MQEHAERPGGKISWLKKWRINRLLDEPEKAAAQKLARLGASALPVLLEATGKGDARSARAAYLIGRLAEAGTDCREALPSLFGLLQNGSELEKGNAAVALARMWVPESISMLIAGIKDGNNITRRYAAVGLGMAPARNRLVEDALRRAAESDCDPKVREIAQNALRQIEGLQK